MTDIYPSRRAADALKALDSAGVDMIAMHLHKTLIQADRKDCVGWRAA